MFPFSQEIPFLKSIFGLEQRSVIGIMHKAVLINQQQLARNKIHISNKSNNANCS